jgi:hypothetical protein
VGPSDSRRPPGDPRATSAHAVDDGRRYRRRW